VFSHWACHICSWWISGAMPGPPGADFQDLTRVKSGLPFEVAPFDFRVSILASCFLPFSVSSNRSPSRSAHLFFSSLRTMAELLDIIVFINALRKRDAGIDNDQDIFMLACGIEDMVGNFGDIEPPVNKIDCYIGFIESHLLHEHDPPHPNVVRILTGE